MSRFELKRLLLMRLPIKRKDEEAENPRPPPTRMGVCHPSTPTVYAAESATEENTRKYLIIANLVFLDTGRLINRCLSQDTDGWSGSVASFHTAKEPDTQMKHGIGD